MPLAIAPFAFRRVNDSMTVPSSRVPKLLRSTLASPLFRLCVCAAGVAARKLPAKAIPTARIEAVFRVRILSPPRRLPPIDNAFATVRCTTNRSAIALIGTPVPASARTAYLGSLEVKKAREVSGLQAVATGALRGTGDTRAPMLSHLVGYWMVGLPLRYFLCYRIRWGAIRTLGRTVCRADPHRRAWHRKVRALARGCRPLMPVWAISKHIADLQLLFIAAEHLAHDSSQAAPRERLCEQHLVLL